VQGRRIVSIVAAANFDRTSVSRLIAADDLTLLPGLVDAHVHLAIGGAVRDNARADVRAGFTTVADLGSLTHRMLRLRDSINAGHIEGPRVLAAGIWVGSKGGVCEFSGIGIAGGGEQSCSVFGATPPLERISPKYVSRHGRLLRSHHRKAWR